MRKQTTGVSRRAYAKMRGVSEATIRKHVNNGNLAEALLPDGTLNPQRADSLLASAVKSGIAEPVALGAAKFRRLSAQVRRLNDQVELLRRSRVPTVDLQEDDELDLEGLTYASLLALRTNLQAEQLELERATSRGHLSDVYKVTEDYEERLAVTKSLLLAIPGRVGLRMESATIEQAEHIIAKEIEHAVEELGGR